MLKRRNQVRRHLIMVAIATIIFAPTLYAQDGCWACRRWRDEVAVGLGSVAVGVGTTVLAARIQGGVQRKEPSIALFAFTAAAVAVAGTRASTNPDRFESVLRAAAVSAPIGQSLGALLGTALGRGSSARTAGGVIGFGLGVLVGGIIGAVAHDPLPPPPRQGG